MSKYFQICPLRICKSGPVMPLNLFHLSIKPTISMMKTESATLDVGVLRWLLWFAIASVRHVRTYIPACGQNAALHCLESNYTALCCRGIPSTFYYTTLQRASLHTSLHYTTIHHTETNKLKYRAVIGLFPASVLHLTSTQCSEPPV